MPSDPASVIVQRRVVLTDPQDCTDNADTLALLEALFVALVRRGPDGRPRPALAERWALSADARRWRFRLRDGFRFHDGTPIDAEAMRRSIARMQRPDVGATLGAPAVWAQYLGGAELTVPDRLTLEIETVEPCADLLDILVSGYAVPGDRVDDSGFLEAPVGSGPYRFVGRTGNGGIRLEAAADWPDGPPANASLEIRPLPDEPARGEALRTGEAALATRLAPASARALAADGRFTVVEHIDPTAILYLLNAARGPFQDPRVRRAVNLAVDRPALIEAVLHGAGTPLHGFVSPAHPGSVPVDPGEAYDPEAARRLLAEAGLGDGIRIGVDCPTSLPDEAETLTRVLADQLVATGMTVEVHRIEDRTAYAERVRDKRIHDMCLFDSSPFSTFRVLHEKIDGRVRGSWWQGYRNPEVERLLDQARSTVDQTAREVLHRRSFSALCADPPWLTLYNHRLGVAFAGRHPDWRMRGDGVLDLAGLPPLG